jgi:ethanolamine utilization cobalamin adenosyltransferase
MTHEEMVENQAMMEETMAEPRLNSAKEYRPSKQEVLREHEIRIHFLHRGCVVHVGCKQIAFEDVSRAMTELNEYVTGDTYEVQQKWRKLLD